MMPANQPALTEPQLAALAKVACGSEVGGGLTLLVGPAGVGKSTVIEALIEDRPAMAAVRPLEAWLEANPHELPATLIVDDAHLASDTSLSMLLARVRARRPEAALVLVGQGRLFTLVARDTRLEQAVRIRATLLPGSMADTRRLAEASLPADTTLRGDAVAALHEIAGGVPAAIVRLTELTTVLAHARPDRLITAADVEMIHGRLSPLAA
ncbi:MAG: hypothetical protein RLZZ440_2321 [Planctomycetota bacterium]